MGKANRIIIHPKFLSNLDSQYCLQAGPQGLILQENGSALPLCHLQEPLLLAQGVAVNSQTVHLVYLKTNGELCYSLVSASGNRQTTALTKLDVRSIKYHSLILLPLGEKVHIFYAYANQAIPDLWNIEHRFWNGKAWQSVHLGEIFHPRFPLYQVATDNQGNIHVLSLTFQGRQSILMHNRFHGIFSIWSNPSQVLKISREVLDMTSILTPDNIHHLFWVAKTPEGQFEVNWAKRTNIPDLTASWHQASAPIHVFNGPWQGIGTFEVNGSLWLLIKAEQEHLLLFGGESWRPVTRLPGQHRPLELIRKTEKSFYHTYWLEDDALPLNPLFSIQLGLDILRPALPPAATHNSAPPIPIPNTPPGVANALPPEAPPADLPAAAVISEISPDAVPPEIQAAAVSSQIPPSEPHPGTIEKHPDPPPDDEQVEPTQAQAGTAPEAKAEPEPAEPQPKEILALTASGEDTISSPAPFQSEISTLNLPEILAPLIAEAVNPLLKTVSALTEEKENLAVALESVLTSHFRTESTLKEIEKQVKELQLNQAYEKEKGFWQKWFK